jgi:site-specific DNA recombinase
MDRLIADAAKGKFDAVIVAYADRWSRDNKKSKEGLDVFREHGIRFFVGTTEKDLFDPQHRFELGLHAEVGEYIAMQQAKKSIEAKIERARMGWPACGSLPWGRTFNRETGKWGLDEAKKAIIEDIAARYIAGELLNKLAAEYHLGTINLYLTLRTKCGDTWMQRFKSAKLNIDESIPTKIPRLLSDETLKAIRATAEGNKTYHHGHAKYRYLLSRVVFCGHCGHAMCGQMNEGDNAYYRHSIYPCTRKGTKAWVRASRIEDTILRHLFEFSGNPAAVKKAIEEATPNRDKIAELRQRRKRLEAELAKTRAGRERVLALVMKGTITAANAEKQLTEAQKKESVQAEQLERLDAALEHLPSQDQIEKTSGQLAALVSKVGHANHNFDAMTWEDKRGLVEMFFAGKTTDGKRMGVYVEWIEGQEARKQKKWRYRIHGLAVYAGRGVSEDLVETLMNAGIPGNAFGWAFLKDPVPETVTTLRRYGRP